MQPAKQFQQVIGRRVRSHRGIAAVEMAMLLPLLVLLVFGAIDASNALASRQLLGSAAYEGARKAIRPDGTSSKVRSFITDFLTEAGIDGPSITLTPAEPADAVPGTPITVSVSVSSGVVSLMDWSLISGTAIESNVVMVKE